MTWLERRISKSVSATPPDNTLSVVAWNMMDGGIDWAALPIVCDILGTEDPESLVYDLVTIRDHMRKMNNG